MKVYKLTPVPTQLDNRSWEASTHKGEMVICAGTEREARFMAEIATVIATDVSPEGVIFPPWQDNQLVTCVEIDDFEVSKEAEIIEPEGFDREWKR